MFGDLKKGTYFRELPILGRREGSGDFARALSPEV